MSIYLCINPPVYLSFYPSSKYSSIYVVLYILVEEGYFILYTFIYVYINTHMYNIYYTDICYML